LGIGEKQLGLINSNQFVSFDLIVADQNDQIELVTPDSTLEDYLHIFLETDRVSFRPEESLLELLSPGDANDSDSVLFYMADNLGRTVRNSTLITDGNIFEIVHGPAATIISGAAVPVTIANFVIDATNISIDDNAANAVNYSGINVDFGNITATNVTLSTLNGVTIDVPDMSVYLDGAAMRITEATTNTIIEFCNESDNAILIWGDQANDGRDWVMIYPQTEEVTADVVNRFIYTTLEDVTINDGANTPEFYGHHMIMRPSAETDVNGTVMYGHYIQLPDAMSAYASGAGLYMFEGSNTIIEMANVASNALLIRGDSFNTARTWVQIIPDAAALTANVNNILLDIDLVNLTISDGANTPEITAIRLDMIAGTETEVDGTVLRAIDIGIPDISAYAAGSAAARIQQSAISIIDILPNTDQFILMSGIAITEARNWLEMTPDTATITANVNTNFIAISAANLTINDGANTPELTGLDIDFNAIIATDVSGTILNAIDITMPTAGGYGTEVAIDVNSTKGDVNNASTLINTFKSVTAAVTADRTITNYGIAHALTGVNTTAGDFDLNMDGGLMSLTMSQTCSTAIDKTNPDSFSSTALLIDIDALTDTNANAELDVDCRAIDINVTFTETLGTLRLADTDFVRIAATIPNGLSSAGAFNLDMLEINADAIVVNDANMTFTCQRIDASGSTFTAAAAAYGLYIEVPAGYTAGLAVVGGVAFDELDLTPTANADALDIILTNNAWTSASAIDIDIGDWIGGSNIIDIAATEAGTVATNASIINIDAGTNVTVNDGAAGTQEYHGINLDFSAITAANANFGTMYGIDITMPAAGHAAWGANKVSAIHATGNGNVFDALLGDGLRLTMNEAASIGLNIISDEVDTANAMQTITTSRDITGALTVDRPMTAYSVAHSINNINTTAGDFDLTMDGGVLSLTMSQTCSTAIDKTNPDTFSGTALLIDIDALTDTNANAELDVDCRAIDINVTFTETLGILRMATSDIFRITPTIPNGLSSAGAFSFNIMRVDGDNITINDGNLTFRGLDLDFSGLTYTAATAAHGLYVSVPSGMTAAAAFTDAIHTTSICDGTNGVSIAVSPTAAMVGLNIDAGSTNRAGDGNIINVDVDVQGAYSVNGMAMSFDFDTTGMGAADNCNCIYMDINEVVAHTDGAGLRGISTIMTGFATGRADLIGHLITFDGTKSGGDFTHGIHIDADSLTLDNVAEIFRGINIDLSALTNTNSATLEGLLITMPAVGTGAAPVGLSVQMNAVTETAFTTNGEIEAGNYPNTNDMEFEVYTVGTYSNCTVALNYEATVGGDANRKGLVLTVTATAGTATAEIYVQYKVPSDFKGWVGTDDIFAEVAAYDAAGGPAVIGTIAMEVYEETNGTAINGDTAAKNLTGGAAADTWVDLNTIDANMADVTSATTGVGEKLLIKFSFAITNINDRIKMSIPDALYSRVAA
jgi:hypothetical protein